MRPHLPAFTKEPKGKHFFDETCFATTFIRNKEQRQINLLIWSIQKREFDEFRTMRVVCQWSFVHWCTASLETGNRQQLLLISWRWECFVLQGLTVINIFRRYHKVEKFSFLITNQVQFETEEPTLRAFSSLNYAFENLMNMYSLVFADTQWCAVNEAYARAFAQQDLLDKQG